MNKIKNLVLALCMLLALVPVSEARRTSKVRNFTSLNQLSGDPEVELAIATRDLNLDLFKRDNGIFRIRDARKLIKTNENTGTIGLAIYEVVNGAREFISEQNITIGSSRRAKKIFVSQDLGRFDTANPTKNLELDVIASDRSVAGTYSTTINAINPEGQVASVISNDFSCTGLAVEECVRNFFIQKVDVIPDATRNRAATVVQNEFTDNIEIKVPVVRRFVKFRAGRRNINVSGNNNSGGSTGGAGAANFGETFDITRIRLGDSAADYANFRYDSNNGQFIIGSGTAANTFVDNFYFSDAGKFGVGVNNPSAFVDVQAGTATMPSLRLNSGTLTTTPINGAIEFDGNDLYLTKNGVRSVLGAQGAQGPAGPAGPQGPVGPQGPAGTIANGGTVDGDVTINGKLFADEVHARLFNGDVFNGGIFNGKFVGDGSMLTGINTNTVNNGSVTGSSIDDSTLNDTTVNGILTFNNNGRIAGNVALAGNLNIAGNINALLGVFKKIVATTNGADITSRGVDRPLKVSYENPSHNGAFIYQSFFRNGMEQWRFVSDTNNDNLRLGTPSLNAITILKSNGNVGIGTTNPTEKLDVDGNVKADKFIGDGSMLTGITPIGALLQANNLSDLTDVPTARNNLGLGALATLNSVSIDTLTDGVASRHSVYLGEFSGASVTNASFNTAVGKEALRNITSGGSNVAVGNSALKDALTAKENVAIGRFAMGNSVNNGGSFVRNIAIGRNAMLNGTGSDNIGLGFKTLSQNTGNNNIALGRLALEDNSTGKNNIGLGNSALANNENGFSNVAIGLSSARFNTTGDGNTALGPDALRKNTTGNRNVAIGNNAGSQLLSGDHNIFIGHSAQPLVNNGSYFLNIGNTIYGDLQKKFVGIGTQTPNARLHVKGPSTFRYEDSRQGAGKILTSDADGFARWSDASAISFTNIIAIDDLTDAINSRNNVILGSNAGTSIKDGAVNIGLGNSALLNLENGNNNVALGHAALRNSKNATRNVAIGRGTMEQSNDTATENVAIGYQAMFQGSGKSNIALGSFSMRFNNTGEFNTGIGSGALFKNETGNNNIALGRNAVRNNVSGSNNVAIGVSAAAGLTEGSNNIYIGHNVAAIKSNGDSLMNIGNTVYGDLSKDQVGIGIVQPQRTLHISRAMRIEPFGTPPANPSLGDIYVDTSNAVCVYVDGAWAKIAGSGTCN